jgi:putative solute:sodium symporter small subunit
MASKKEYHWAKTRSLTFTVLAVWAIFSFVIHWAGEGLNSPSFPGAYFMAGMGSQIAFAILVFWFASRQNKIDEEFGLEEK